MKQGKGSFLNSNEVRCGVKHDKIELPYLAHNNLKIFINQLI